MRAPVELVEIAIRYPYHFRLTFFFPYRDDRDFKAATGMPRSPPKKWRKRAEDFHGFRM